MKTKVFRSATLPHGVRFAILGFGLLLVAPASPAVTEGDAPGPTATAPAASTNLTALDANGFRVALDTTGFKQDFGYENFQGNYFRIAQFHTDKEHASEMGGGFTFSLLVDDLPPGVKELEELFVYDTSANPLADLVKDGRLKVIRSYPALNGLLYRYPRQVPIPKDEQETLGPELRQWQWYFHSIQNGKWFEIHFSRIVALDAPVPEGIEPVIDRILRSLQFPAPPAK
jgi:hypothetical protein